MGLNFFNPQFLRCRLAGLATNLLAFVPDTFAFVWFGLAHRANFGGEFADELLIGAFDHNVRLIRTGHLQALRQDVGCRDRARREEFHTERGRNADAR